MDFGFKADAIKLSDPSAIQILKSKILRETQDE